MDTAFLTSRYTDRYFQDNEAGCAGLDLMKTQDGTTVPVAKITFWDAVGQFHFEMSREEKEIPLHILTEFISEAERRVPTI